MYTIWVKEQNLNMVTYVDVLRSYPKVHLRYPFEHSLFACWCVFEELTLVVAIIKRLDNLLNLNVSCLTHAQWKP